MEKETHIERLLKDINKIPGARQAAGATKDATPNGKHIDIAYDIFTGKIIYQEVNGNEFGKWQNVIPIMLTKTKVTTQEIREEFERILIQIKNNDSTYTNKARDLTVTLK